jgi:glycine oxidase ThiO
MSSLFSSPGYLSYMSRVVVIGGGVIGCAIAERLSFEGHQVTLLERDQLAGHASGAAAGELSPQSTTAPAEEAANQSLLLFPELIARIEKDSAISVEYRVQEGLQPAFDQEEAARLRAGGGRWLDAQACREAEPSLSTDVLGAVLLEHAHLTPLRFARALARAAAARGAQIHEGTPVSGFERSDGVVRRVITPSGSYEADWAIIAAGPWSKEVASTAGVDVDVRPQRGQLAALDPGAAASLKRSIFWSNGYLVPKADGTIIAGGTEEESGFDDRPTVAGIATLLNLACRLVPGLGTAVLQRVWAGLRPVTRDGKPIVKSIGAPNLIVATGHHRKGILLAPLAAMQVASLIS